ncbi:glycosyl hydrolase [Rufibacter hautae]|uniref:Glycosyl hydrolase family 26 n=1 Tax=Rufibacter hautae TaxID=2595005 RepID=A0A5B6TH77_9BACT|nr:glycosyl hydrolase [Rufibacter hautae]KAA3440034.1 glycosyl hydrolase family 26 [Rufibacter hautae]
MRKTFLFSFLIFSLQCLGQGFAPVNPNATPEAKKLLAYLYQINGKHLLSGQHNYNETPNKFSEMVVARTGKQPAIWGTDFIWRGTQDPGAEIVKEAIQKHQQGHIVTLMWHAGRPIDTPPFRWKESIQGELTDQQWKELTTPGSALHKVWLAQVDQTAEYLKQLQAANVPVLWRPYHEMNGVWFWWGDKKGKDGYQKLWTMLYDRYTNHHKLNNLLWVWNANAPRDIPKDEAFAYHLFYPGAKYVDILATDVYNFDYEQKDYNELLALAKGKLITLGEVGELPKPEILQAQPKWSWFMVWANWIETHNTPERVKEVYNLPQTLTLDELAATKK